MACGLAAPCYLRRLSDMRHGNNEIINCAQLGRSNCIQRADWRLARCSLLMHDAWLTGCLRIFVSGGNCNVHALASQGASSAGDLRGERSYVIVGLQSFNCTYKNVGNKLGDKSLRTGASRSWSDGCKMVVFFEYCNPFIDQKLRKDYNRGVHVGRENNCWTH